MMDVTVVLLGGNYASTVLAPVEVFHSAGQLWPALNGEDADPAFRVTQELMRACAFRKWPMSFAHHNGMSDPIWTRQHESYTSRQCRGR